MPSPHTQKAYFFTGVHVNPSQIWLNPKYLKGTLFQLLWKSLCWTRVKSVLTHPPGISHLCVLQKLWEVLIRFSGLIKDIKLHSYFMHYQSLQIPVTIHIDEVNGLIYVNFLPLIGLLLSYSLKRSLGILVDKRYVYLYAGFTQSSLD